MNYPPNIDAAGWFCDEILPILRSKHPEICFKIVGDKPGPAVSGFGAKKGLQVTGRVPDVRPYLAESLALVVPLRSGGGTRLKISRGDGDGTTGCLDHQGAEGLEITDGVNILLADTPEDFAQAYLRFNCGPTTWKTIGSCRTVSGGKQI